MEKVIKSKKGKRNKKHGFLKRSRTRTGKSLLKRRRLRGRKRI